MSEKKSGNTVIYGLLAVLIGLMIFNQITLLNINSAMTTTSVTGASAVTASADSKDISSVNLGQIKSTAQSIAYLFDVSNVKTEQDAMNVIIPQGTPDYGAQLGVSYDDPVNGLSKLHQTYSSLQLTGADQERYVSIVTKTVGISCEFCCGVGAVGADANGDPICGCQHNPALLGLTKWLVKNTDYTDQEIVKEALKWKALFFPQKMVETTLAVAGTDASSVANLPGMVGGC
ncbi:MAG: hypothetical protein ACE5J7_05225 [Candidatus Aenigmatarchaeota archaeon]